MSDDGDKREAIDETLVQSDDQKTRAASRSSGAFVRPDLPGYEVRERLGAGAYGEVWLAIQTNTGREVAVKFFSRHKGLDWPLLKREVGKLVQVISERRVVHLLEVGWDAEPPYYVMEYLGGRLSGRPSRQRAAFDQRSRVSTCFASSPKRSSIYTTKPSCTVT